MNKLEELRVYDTQKKNRVEAQLKTVVQTQLDEARQGLELLGQSATTIEEMRTKYVRIVCAVCSLSGVCSFVKTHDFCREVSNLIPSEEYSLIIDVNIARSNLRRTLKEVERMLSIPERVRELFSPQVHC